MFSFFFKSFPAICLLLISLSAYGNERIFNKITRKDGLSHSSVYSLVRDKQGLMWFGTGNGLNCFNGDQISLFKNDPDNPNTLSHNNSGNLYIDSTGIIWIGTWGGGLNSLDPKTLKITRYLNDPDDPTSISDNKVQSIYKDSRGKLWVGTRSGGLNYLDINKGTFKRFQHDPEDDDSISNNRVWSVVEDKNGFIWVGSDHGLNRYDPKTGRFTRYVHDPHDPTSLSHSRVRNIYINEFGAFWIGTQLGLNLFDPDTGKATRFYTYSRNIKNENGYNTINAITQDAKGTLWVGAANYGLFEFNPETGQFIQYLNDSNYHQSISHNDIRYLYIDPSQVLWIGTRGGGVNLLDLKGKKFKAYSHVKDQTNSLGGQVVLSLLEDKDQDLWIGTQHNGLDLYDTRTKEYKHFKYLGKNTGGIRHNTVEHIYQDKKNRIWIATPVGLGQVDKKTGQFAYTTEENSPLIDNDVYSIFEDKDGFLWLGMSKKGLVQYNVETNEFKVFRNSVNDSESLSDDYNVQAFLETDDCLWVGTQNGLNCLNKNSGKFKQYFHDIKNPKSISDSTIQVIHQDQLGRIWVGTHDGLNLMVDQKGDFLRFSRNEGIASATINGILEDKAYLWLSTNKGISQMNMHTFQFRNFNVDEGMQSPEFKVKSFFKSKRGELFFGSVQGFNSVIPGAVVKNYFKPPVILTDFKKFNRSVNLDYPISYLENLDLSYRDNFFSFEFIALDYTNPDLNRYAYKLEGFDPNWIPTDSSRRHATYTNLNGGQYVFKVKASNNDGVWNEQGLSIGITVSNPPYKTWPAYVSYVITLSLLIFYFVHRQRKKYKIEIQTVNLKKEEINKLNEELEKRVKKRTYQLTEINHQLQYEIQFRREAEKELLEAKMQAEKANFAKSEFLANMSHELRTPMHAILSFSQFGVKNYLSNHREKLLYYFEQTKKSGKHLLILLNDLLDLSKLEAGKMRYQKDNNNIIQTIEECISELSTILKDKKLKIIIEQGSSSLNAFYDEFRLKQVIRNLVSNAIKFSFNGDTICIFIEESELTIKDKSGKADVIVPALQLSVKDMGIGIPESELNSVFEKFAQSSKTKTGAGGTGLGLSICYEIVKEHHGIIWAENNPTKGSVFKFLVPVNEPNLD